MRIGDKREYIGKADIDDSIEDPERWDGSSAGRQSEHLGKNGPSAGEEERVLRDILIGEVWGLGGYDVLLEQNKDDQFVTAVKEKDEQRSVRWFERLR